MTTIGITTSQNFDSNNLVKLVEKFGAKHELLSLNTNIENAQYLILTNRTLYSQKMGKISNCFDEFNFKNIFYVKRNGVILSAIKKIDK